MYITNLSIQHQYMEPARVRYVHNRAESGDVNMYVTRIHGMDLIVANIGNSHYSGSGWCERRRRRRGNFRIERLHTNASKRNHVFIERRERRSHARMYILLILTVTLANVMCTYITIGAHRTISVQLSAFNAFFLHISSVFFFFFLSLRRIERQQKKKKRRNVSSPSYMK